jgi:hypothetical protein
MISLIIFLKTNIRPFLNKINIFIISLIISCNCYADITPTIDFTKAKYDYDTVYEKLDSGESISKWIVKQTGKPVFKLIEDPEKKIKISLGYDKKTGHVSRIVIAQNGVYEGYIIDLREGDLNYIESYQKGEKVGWQIKLKPDKKTYDLEFIKQSEKHMDKNGKKGDAFLNK